MGHGCVELPLDGGTFRLMPCRAAYWVETRTLLVSDLHLGKIESYIAHGIGLPTIPLETQLRRLSDAMIDTGARRVMILGDLLHAPIGLTTSLVESVASWRSRHAVDLFVIRGNHDRRIESIADRWRLTVVNGHHQENGFSFTHDPADRNGGFTWAGHLHPAITLGGRADRLKLPCFIVSPEKAVLPAFSTFTSGGRVRTSAEDRIYPIADGRVWELPGHALCTR